jgi:hypothetical protein
MAALELVVAASVVDADQESFPATHCSAEVELEVI